MLVAYGPDGHPIVAEEAPREQLQRWSREHVLHCPNCRGIVHVRGGPEKRTQLHFAHQKGECVWSTETESVRHARGKTVLAQWLREQFPGALITLEKRLPEPNRIADVFVTHLDGQRWAIEFQCAALNFEQWQYRHLAYRKANILDIWIIGNNRREKQEAFLEAILSTAHEVMFLNPLVLPARVELRWVVSRDTVREWQQERHCMPTLGAWVGSLGIGASLHSQLQELRLGQRGKLDHLQRSTLEIRTRLLHRMRDAEVPDGAILDAYLSPIIGEQSVCMVIKPLMRAYLRDPDLLRRYNYGRASSEHPLSGADKHRVQQARLWLNQLALKGFPVTKLQELAKEIPFVGPYAAFATYLEMLAALS